MNLSCNEININKLFIRQKGFTLLEILIATSIFSMLIATAYVVLQQGVRSRSIIDERTDQLAEVQHAFFILQQDVEQIINRPVRNVYQDYSPPLQIFKDSQIDYARAIEFTRTGWRNPLRMQRSNLQRINYRIENNQLIRRTWNSLDRTPDTQFSDLVLLSDIEQWQTRFLYKGKWMDNWINKPKINNKYDLPDALEIKIYIENLGSLRRVFKVVSSY
ncbi:MAG: type II secretion system minor pseudopilin GspJ [Proteobacteria bacterium]|nr:type II secretion system minor pseudopilin GspJ [Pseudomonadota bacterium]